jgi:hypothetical protein
LGNPESYAARLTEEETDRLG